ncbi:glucosyltransferase domain-containing protein [Aeromonas sp. QDB04]|uniref:glucosyltransferase domain-containing protein n=1 Tax=Aeromonas sp. QDB04 TaxID=2990477 RepID=UPI0022E565F7|nr:glucosyltransferase domain-containing protein [Aeromonas sp. QDB04]
MNHYLSTLFSNKDSRKFVVFLSCLCFLYIIPIVLADRYYIDDMGRGQYGYYNWADNGRPLADFILSFLVGGDRLTNASPLFLFFGTVCFIFCCYEYHKSNPCLDMSVTAKKAWPFMSGLVFFYIYANPFMLENISYKFDSLPMLLSLSILLMAFVKRPGLYEKLIPIIIVIASLSLYQASIGMFVCLAVIECVRYISTNERKSACDVLKLPFVRITQLIIAYVIYAKLIQPLYLIGEYNYSHSELIEFNFNGLEVFVRNALIYIDKIKDVALVFKYQFIVLSIFFVIHSFIVMRRLISNEGGINAAVVVSLLIVTLSPVIVLMSSFGHLSLLESPVFASRTLISFGGFLFYLAYASHQVLCRWRVGRAFSLIVCVYFFIASYSYGNALKAQKERDLFIASAIVSKIHEIDFNGIKSVKIFGSQPSSTIRDSVIVKYKYMSDLIPLHMVNGWSWGGSMLALSGLKNSFELGVNLDDVCKAKISYKSREFFIRELDNILIVDFANPECKD